MVVVLFLEKILLKLIEAQTNYLAAAIKKYPLVLALHEADVEATYLLEKEE